MIDGIAWLLFTVYLEAQGEGVKGQKDVAKVILTRAHERNMTIKEVVLEDRQFSCWDTYNMTGDLPTISYIHVFADIFPVVYDAINEWTNGDNAQRANLYYNPSKCNPAWADSPLVTKLFDEGNHTFLREDR